MTGRIIIWSSQHNCCSRKIFQAVCRGLNNACPQCASAFPFRQIIIKILYLHRPTRGLSPGRCQCRAVARQQLEAESLLSDRAQTKPIRLFHRRRMRAHANLELFGTTPSCENDRTENECLSDGRRFATQQSTYPSFGPPWVRSKTWRGFRSHWNFCRSFAP